MSLRQRAQIQEMLHDSLNCFFHIETGSNHFFLKRRAQYGSSETDDKGTNRD